MDGNSFHVFEIPETAEEAARVFTEFQGMRIHNIRAEMAHKMLTLKFDPMNPGTFVQDQAYIQGWIEACNKILGLGD